MDAPSPGTSVYVKGYKADSGREIPWHVDFPSGYHELLLVKLEKFTGEPSDGMGNIEIWADFGYDALDWEFCIDNVEVHFEEASDHPHERSSPEYQEKL